MSLKWSKWCRLCSKDSESEVDVGQNFGSTVLKDIIEKFFSISIDNNDELPKKICHDCYRFLINLDVFGERVSKVNRLFTEILRNNICLLDDDMDSIRSQYGIYNENYSNKNDKCTEANETMAVYFEVNTEDENSNDSKPIAFRTRLNKSNNALESNERRGNYEIDSDYDKNDPIYIVVKSEKDEDMDEIDDQGEDYNEKKPIKKRTRKRKTKKLEIYLDNDNNDDNDGKDNNESEYIKEEKTKKKRKSNDILKCEICSKLFSRKDSLRYHMENVHSLPQDYQFSCKQCGKKFVTEKRLNLHEYSHLPVAQKALYPCPFCNKKFTKSVNVNPHIRAVHIGEKSFICEECGKTFVTKGALKEHRYTHIEDTPFQCSKCPKKFKNSARLKTHEDTHNDTVYVCPHCGLQLNTRRTLNMHMVIHSDKKKYKCEYCGNEYKRSKTLKNHLILHTGLRPYTCPFCDKTFANGSNCRSHKKKAHPVELAAMEISGENMPTANIPRLDQLKAGAAKSVPPTNQKIVKLKQKTIGNQASNSQTHTPTPTHEEHESSSLNEGESSLGALSAPMQEYHTVPNEMTEEMQMHRQSIYEHLRLALS